jgi:hypothetical protein
VEDLPILITKLERMKVRELVDGQFVLHGNWQGSSLGTVMTV